MAAVVVLVVIVVSLLVQFRTDRSFLSVFTLWVLIPSLFLGISAIAVFSSEYVSIRYKSKLRVAGLAGCLLSFLFLALGLMQPLFP